jgi:hypothetical protein
LGVYDPHVNKQRDNQEAMLWCKYAQHGRRNQIRNGGIKKMSKKSIIVSIIVGTLLCMGPIRANALSIYFDQLSVNVIEGDNFTVDLLADIGELEQILGWDIDLLYNNAQVAYTEYTVGSSWNAVTPIPDNDESMAGLAPFDLPWGTGIYGNGVHLATLSFNCLAVGTSFLNIGIDDALEGFQLAAVPGGFASWEPTATTVNQAPVPEPSTILLVGTGLLGIIGFGRKRLNKKA